MRAQVGALRITLLAVAAALATIALGWLGIVLVAALFAAIDRRRVSVPYEVSAAAALGWLGLVAIAGRGSLTGVAPTMATAMGLPWALLLILVIAYPAALAGSAAAVTQLIALRVRR